MRALVLVCLCFAGSLLASPGSVFTFPWSGPEDDTLFTSVEEVTPPADANIDFMARDQSISDDCIHSDISAATLGTIVNIGEKVWKLIEKNKPVVDVRYTYANAIPECVKSSSELERFSDLQSRSFRMHAKNWFGSTVYDVTYTLLHRFGGSYKGRGQFLENVTVLPSKVSALWGYTVNMNVTNVSAVNVGTTDSPIGSVLMDMNFSVSTVFKAHQVRSVFQFRGDSNRAIAVN